MRRMHCHGVSIIRATPTRMQGGRFARASQATLGERAKSWGPSCRRLRALIVFVCLEICATSFELGNEIDHFRKWRERGELGGDIGEFWRQAAFKCHR